MKLYVKGNSKKAINEAIAAGESIHGENFSIFGGGGIYRLDSTLPKDTIISIFSKYSGGSPVAKSYGTWTGTKIK